MDSINLDYRMEEDIAIHSKRQVFLGRVSAISPRTLLSGGSKNNA
jgi:hypothetical protein